MLQSANPDLFLSHVDFGFMEHPEEFGVLAGAQSRAGELDLEGAIDRA